MKRHIGMHDFLFQAIEIYRPGENTYRIEVIRTFDNTVLLSLAKGFSEEELEEVYSKTRAYLEEIYLSSPDRR